MKGLYKENVDMNAKSPVMIYGDGMTQTVFTGDHSFGDNYTTYNSYTLAAKGPGVILQDLCVRNTAGAAKHQAVALMVGGDKSIINRCFLDGYQDTLYTHSKRQFYRDCTVTGTIDFVFGNAAVVLQNCTLVAKKPGPAQQNMVTAQGRADPNQNTGISLHLCNLTPSPKLKPVIDRFPTFLGRPWRNFARTMVMESYIGAHINPAGWHEWSGTVFLDTLWFGEFSNHGPGSATKSRVKWSTFHAISDRSVASKFTVSGLLQDEEKWVIQSGVDCMEGLLPPRKINQTNVNSHKEATPFRTRSFKFYNELSKIYSKDRAIGKDAQTADDVVEEIQAEEQNDIRVDTDDSTFVGLDDFDFMSTQVEPQNDGRKRSNSSKRKRSTDEAIEICAESMLNAAKLISNTMSEVGKNLSDGLQYDRDMDMFQKLDRVLQEVDGLTLDEMDLVSLKLTDHPNKVAFFLSLHPDGRLQWIRRFLAGH
ncbi:pectinesterase 2.2-like [Ipomoea triloba]|uniref:pectinesterase 2.2-like n=1 Tax=Ipomoea triloba TaxID=35885 RepID=UPI00125E003A|nr:pectinesterase 2.2-like [Ipomoea triloba]